MAKKKKKKEWDHFYTIQHAQGWLCCCFRGRSRCCRSLWAAIPALDNQQKPAAPITHFSIILGEVGQEWNQAQEAGGCSRTAGDWPCHQWWWCWVSPWPALHLAPHEGLEPCDPILLDEVTFCSSHPVLYVIKQEAKWTEMSLPSCSLHSPGCAVNRKVARR